jgi:putative ABC transport system permease protein
MWILIRLAWRNLWRNRRRTWISVGSVFFAVALSLILESMDRGSQEGMVRNTVRYSTGYIQLMDTLQKDEPSIDNAFELSEETQKALIQQYDAIALFVPRLESFTLAAGEERTKVSLIYGVDPQREHQFNEIGERMIEGELNDLGPGGVIIGAGLSRYLGLGIGDTIVYIGQGFYGATAAGKFEIIGIVKHPVPHLNEMLSMLSMEDAQWLFSAYDRYSGVFVVPKKEHRYDELVEQLRSDELLADLAIYSWEELQPELVRTLEFDRAGTFIFLLILYVVIGFGIFGTILTMTLEREQEFGVLISIGMHRWKLASVILFETLVMNFVGVLLGVVLMLPVIIYFHLNPISLGEDLESLMAEYGLEAVLPFSMDPQIFIQQASIVFVMSMVIALYPVMRVFRIKVLEASRS